MNLKAGLMVLFYRRALLSHLLAWHLLVQGGLMGILLISFHHENIYEIQYIIVKYNGFNKFYYINIESV